MSSNLLRAVLLVVAIGLLVYLFNQDGTILNEGELTLPVGNYNTYNNNQVKNINTSSSYNVESSTNVPSNYTNKQQRIVVHPQVDDELNPIPKEEQPNKHKSVQFASQVEYPEMDLVKHNKAVIPFPQYSNNYAPLNGVSASMSNGIGTKSQAVDNIKSSCQPGLSCYPKDTVTAQELLPRDDPYNMFSQVNPDTPGHLADQNFLESGHHFGINTVGSSLRNANQQLRSDPPIPQIAIGPWNQSTISPDTNRRAFDIGSDY